MAKICAAVWDFNGTVDNSEHIRRNSIAVSLADFGYEFRDSDYPEIMKRVGFAQPSDYICKLYGIADQQAFQAHWESRFGEILDRDLALLPGVLKSLEQMREAGLKLAVASSAHRDYIAPALTRLGVADRFEAVVTRDDITGSGKPDPEVFHQAAVRLGVSTRDCVAIGDSAGDVIGAVSAGMKVIYVPGPYEVGRFSLNTVVTLPSLEHFNWEVIRQLEGPQVVSRERGY
ncbi:HAD family phosphatase [Candidatus Curtissbacteria bacterium]|nr:HAD family phosphatase [Candidatus Curtissbacteria bacterium]